MLEGEVGAVADCESCEGERCYTEVEGRHGVWLQRVRSVVGMLATSTPTYVAIKVTKAVLL